MKAKKINKTSFNEYLKLSGFSPFSPESRVLSTTLCAYADCIEEKVDTKGLERNLSYFRTDSVSLSEALIILALATPDGYNNFNASKLLEPLSDIFGRDARVFLAREGSVCFYIKPSVNVWFRSDVFQDIADEVCFDADLGAFRLWWD